MEKTAGEGRGYENKSVPESDELSLRKVSVFDFDIGRFRLWLREARFPRELIPHFQAPAENGETTLVTVDIKTCSRVFHPSASRLDSLT